MLFSFVFFQSVCHITRGRIRLEIFGLTIFRNFIIISPVSLEYNILKGQWILTNTLCYVKGKHV